MKNGTSLLAEGERLLKVARQVADRSNFANARDLTNARDLADGSERINGGDLSGFAALARPAKLAGLVGLADAREPDIGLLLNGFERKMKERMLKRSKRFLI